MKSLISLNILFLLLLNPLLPSNDTSFFLKDGISCSTHLSISAAPYRIISIMVTDFLACDGSDVNISHNLADERTFIHEDEKGYNAIHINALYDITNKTYCDFLVQGKKKLQERSALNTMIDRYPDPVRAILMADRDYESFNTFAHLIRKRMYFVIRMKDINSNGIFSAYDLPDSEFDTHIRTTLTRRHTKETLGNPDTYTILQPSTDFDFFDESCMYYDIEFRIVRIRLDNGTYICIATNLSGEEFPLEEINKLYRMR